MRWFTTSCLVLLITIASTSADWSWGDKDDASKDKAKDKANVDLQSDLLEGESIDKEDAAQPKSWTPTNDTVLDEIVDELVNQKQGRSLGGFDDVYSDPQIKEALDSGKDASAKDLIKSRLCDLGLIQCEDEDVQEKRYFSPDELIYAQPVDIKPVGQPVASIPIRGPPRAYGPAKPMPQYYTRPQKTQLPKRIGYGGSQSYGRPGFSEKYGVAGNNNFQFSQSNSLYGGQDSNYVTRPPQYTHENPYAFEHTKPGYNKVPTTNKPQTVVQQHVHHHYVHEDNKDPKVIIKPVAIPVGSVGNLVSQGLPQQTPDIITGPGGDYSGFTSNGFKPMTASYNLDSSDTIYGSQKPNSNNYYSGQNGLGNFGPQSNDFYKKEFHVGSSANNLYNQGPAVFSQNQNNAYQQGFHEPKAQDFDCVCVNFDQCPSEEIIGRRDDLYLPIDPRNKASDITALTDEQAENLNATETTELHAVKAENETVTETKKLSKREAKEEKSQDAAKEAEPRLIGLAGYGGYGGNGNKKVQPTFGVSFGLPQPSHGGYPINPFNSNPLHNPYGPALNGGGLNLGLVSVNPLLAVQVTKNDYGEKVVKPFVNLHVTPNEHVVNKLGHLFHEKKLYLLNKHEHFHHYNTHSPGHHYHGFHEKPFIHPSYGPPAHYEPQHVPHYPPPHYPPPHHPPHFGPPPYSPHFQHYEPAHFKHHPETGPGNDDYYDDDNDNSYDNNADYNPHQAGFYNPGFERSANLSANNRQGYADRFSYSRSLTLPSRNPGANREGQTVRFPENRKKREVEKPVYETVEERQFYGGRPQTQQCRQNQVCCRRPLAPQAANKGQCGIRHSQGINGRIKTPSYVDGDSEFGEYPWQAAILKKDPKESIYACGGTLIDNFHIITAAHCIKSFKAFELRVRLGEWDVNHDVEFYPYIERDVVAVHIHPLYYAGTLDNDLAILKMDRAVEWNVYPHISPACLPDKYTDYAGQRCWTTGWGKDAFGDFGKYQNILKEVDVPILGHNQCQQQLRQTRLGYNYELNKGFLCAGGEEGKDACKGDGGGPLVCERGGTWQLVGVVSWGIGCGQPGVPGVYVKVAHYLDWISQITGKFSPY